VIQLTTEEKAAYYRDHPEELIRKHEEERSWQCYRAEVAALSQEQKRTLAEQVMKMRVEPHSYDPTCKTLGWRGASSEKKRLLLQAELFLVRESGTKRGRKPRRRARFIKRSFTR
jgi:hypothetical protein